MANNIQAKGQCKALPSTSDLEELIHCAEATPDGDEIDDTLALGSVVYFFLGG